MTVLTKFGRKKADWEYDASAFCKRGGILPESAMGQSLYRLSDDEFQKLTAVCDPEYDALVSVEADGFSVNHGNVGSSGYCYNF